MISPSTCELALPLCEDYSPYLSKLKALYSEMDERYENTASRYGFVCRGCEDNCCRTRFYHHTCLEYLYMKEGFNQLSDEMRHKVRANARSVYLQMEADEKAFGPMCPLNMEERCILYAHRPMICRLHGIPHELRKPGSQARYHQGCNAFHKRHGEKPYFEFDRTPLYMAQARLEKDLKSAMKMTAKIKFTIAEMLVMQ